MFFAGRSEVGITREVDVEGDGILRRFEIKQSLQATNRRCRPPTPSSYRREPTHCCPSSLDAGAAARLTSTGGRAGCGRSAASPVTIFRFCKAGTMRSKSDEEQEQ